jgi:hypothetical protein
LPLNCLCAAVQDYYVWPITPLSPVQETEGRRSQTDVCNSNSKGSSALSMGQGRTAVSRSRTPLGHGHFNQHLVALDKF